MSFGYLISGAREQPGKNVKSKNKKSEKWIVKSEERKERKAIFFFILSLFTLHFSLFI